MKCNCGDEMFKLTSQRMFVCFGCMHASVEGSSFPHLLYKRIRMVRKGQNNWIVGSNPQTTVNLMRSQELEKLYELWLAKRILE